ncbi:MAG: hypothetical protein JWM44_3892 [Bacilli bacterium]|nr:hypothetical protein [Bacilli bacterium]
MPTVMRMEYNNFHQTSQLYWFENGFIDCIMNLPATKL